MKRVLSLLVVVIAVVSFTSCGSGTPDKTATNFMEKFSKGDFEGAKKYATPKSEVVLSAFTSRVNPEDLAKMKESKVEFKDMKCETTSDTTAICECQMIEPDEEPQDMKLPLVKKDNKWLVELSKEY